MRKRLRRAHKTSVYRDRERAKKKNRRNLFRQWLARKNTTSPRESFSVSYNDNMRERKMIMAGIHPKTEKPLPVGADGCEYLP